MSYGSHTALAPFFSLLYTGQGQELTLASLISTLCLDNKLG